MQTRSLEENVRRRLSQYLEPSVAACAGLTIFDLQQIVAGVLVPTPKQLNALARRMQLLPYQFPNTGTL